MIQPYGARVLIRPIESEAKTSSGVIIPDSEVERPMKGTVVAVGEAVPTTCAEGTVVYYPRYTGANVEVDNETLIIVQFEDLLGFETTK